MKSQLFGVVLTLCTLVSSAAATDVEPGLAESVLGFAPPLFGVSATFSTGAVIAFDGQLIERYSANGVLLQTYATLPAFVFPSFIVLSPNEAFAVAGESSTGDILRIDIGTGAVTTLTSLANNYDAFIDPANDVFISAAASVSGMNDLIRVDPSSGIPELLAQVPGFSGPIARRANGDLLLGLSDTPNRVISYTAAQLVGGVVLDELGRNARHDRLERHLGHRRRSRVRRGVCGRE